MKTISYSLTKALAIMGLFICSTVQVAAQSDQNIVYPANSGVVNMVTSYSLRVGDSSPTAASFNTVQIQKAIDENKDRLQQKTGILYFPNGTYYISNKLTLGDSSGVNDQGVLSKTVARYITIQGQSRTGTVLKLINGSAGFANLTTGKPMLAFFGGEGSNALFRNYLRNITIDVGANNPGAIGVDFHCNNHGGIFDVIIKSSDAQQRGLIGLKMNRKLTGIGMVKHLRVEGFDKGIVTGSYKISYVFEHVELDGQKVTGLENTEKPIQIRKLTTTNQYGPSVVNKTAPGHIVLIDSELNRNPTSTTATSAIDNQQGFLFVRNVTTTGYLRAIKNGTTNVPNVDIAEYSSRGTYRLWTGQNPSGFTTPTQSMNLRIAETPQVPWETDMNKWVVVEVGGNGDQDDAPTVQAAIDQCTVASGKNTVFIKIPGDKFINMRSPIIIRGNVQRFLMPGTMFKILTPLLNETNALIKIETTDAEVLEIEGTHVAAANTTGRMTILQNNSTKTVVLRDVSTFTGQRFYQNAPNAGPLFIEISGHQKKDNNADSTTIGWEITNQKVWARDFNLMEDMGTGLINDGGQLWILGYKFESLVETEQTAVIHSMITKNGGFTEVLGGVDNEVYRKNAGSAVVVNDNSHVSHISSERASSNFNLHRLLVREKRSTSTRDFTRGELPLVNVYGRDSSEVSIYVDCSVIPLYLGYNPTEASNTHTFSSETYFNDARNYDEKNSYRWDVVKDQTSNNRRYILRTTDYNGLSGDKLGEYSLVKDRSYGNFTISLRAKTREKFTENPSADFAVVFGFENAGNYYYVLFTKDQSSTKLYKVTNSVATAIATASAPGILNETDYHNIEIIRSGNTVTVKRNTTSPLTTIISITNTSLGTAGRVGIGSINDAASFDDIAVTPPGGSRLATEASLTEATMPEIERPLINYPNPFTHQTTLRYYLSEEGPVKLYVQDAAGRSVATLVDDRQAAGVHEVSFSGSQLQAGIYVGQLRTATGSYQIKLLLVK